jgi:hypothetical protein
VDAFSYLSVLLSIIIGLAMTQILLGYRGLLLARARVTFYAPTIIWSGLLLIMAAQNWWASFGYTRHREEWTFLAFGVVLLQTVLLYMMAGLVLPDMPPGQPIDLKDHYYRERRVFFGLFLAMLAVSVSKDWAVDGSLPSIPNLVFHGVFAALSVTGLLVKRPRFHEIVTPLLALIAAGYIALLFARLT